MLVAQKRSDLQIKTLERDLVRAYGIPWYLVCVIKGFSSIEVYMPCGEQ